MILDIGPYFYFLLSTVSPLVVGEQPAQTHQEFSDSSQVNVLSENAANKGDTSLFKAVGKSGGEAGAPRSVKGATFPKQGLTERGTRGAAHKEQASVPSKRHGSPSKRALQSSDEGRQSFAVPSHKFSFQQVNAQENPNHRLGSPSLGGGGSIAAPKAPSNSFSSPGSTGRSKKTYVPSSMVTNRKSVENKDSVKHPKPTPTPAPRPILPAAQPAPLVPAVAPAQPIAPAVAPAQPIVPAVAPVQPIVPAVAPVQPIAPAVAPAQPQAVVPVLPAGSAPPAVAQVPPILGPIPPHISPSSSTDSLSALISEDESSEYESSEYESDSEDDTPLPVPPRPAKKAPDLPPPLPPRPALPPENATHTNLVPPTGPSPIQQGQPSSLLGPLAGLFPNPNGRSSFFDLDPIPRRGLSSSLSSFCQSLFSSDDLPRPPSVPPTDSESEDEESKHESDMEEDHPHLPDPAADPLSDSEIEDLHDPLPPVPVVGTSPSEDPRSSTESPSSLPKPSLQKGTPDRNSLLSQLAAFRTDDGSPNAAAFKNRKSNSSSPAVTTIEGEQPPLPETPLPPPESKPEDTNSSPLARAMSTKFASLSNLFQKNGESSEDSSSDGEWDLVDPDANISLPSSSNPAPIQEDKKNQLKEESPVVDASHGTPNLESGTISSQEENEPSEEDDVDKLVDIPVTESLPEEVKGQLAIAEKNDAESIALEHQLLLLSSQAQRGKDVAGRIEGVKKQLQHLQAAVSIFKTSFSKHVPSTFKTAFERYKPLRRLKAFIEDKLEIERLMQETAEQYFTQSATQKVAITRGSEAALKRYIGTSYDNAYQALGVTVEKADDFKNQVTSDVEKKLRKVKQDVSIKDFVDKTLKEALREDLKNEVNSIYGTRKMTKVSGTHKFILMQEIDSYSIEELLVNGSVVATASKLLDLAEEVAKEQDSPFGRRSGSRNRRDNEFEQNFKAAIAIMVRKDDGSENKSVASSSTSSQSDEDMKKHERKGKGVVSPSTSGGSQANKKVQRKGKGKEPSSASTSNAEKQDVPVSLKRSPSGRGFRDYTE